MTWSNIQKWVVRYADNKDVDLNEFAKYIACGDVCERTTDGENSALHFAAVGEASTTLEFLLNIVPKRSINSPNKNGETPLHWACRSGTLSNIKALLDAGANPRCVDYSDNNILHFANNGSSV